MSVSVNNRGEADYAAKMQQLAEALQQWPGPIVLVAHENPDGDALGSTLALKRALDSIGNETLLPLEPPHFLRFLAEEGELSPPLQSLPPNCLLAVLDVADKPRIDGITPACFDEAAFVINIDHHGTNDRFGDISCVEPRRAATAHMVKDLIEALAIPWTPAIATPCLTGILTDTGNLRFSNTTPEVLQAVAALIDQGVAYAELTDRLQWRHPDYFRMLGQVMNTVEFFLDGRLVMGHITLDMHRAMQASNDDSDDYVGILRYAQGSQLAVLLKERDVGKVKVSARSRGAVSAQAVCVALGGGGHVAAAGASLAMSLEEAKAAVLEAASSELARHSHPDKGDKG